MKWNTQKAFVSGLLSLTIIVIAHNIYIQQQAFAQLHQALISYRHASTNIVIEPTLTPEPTPFISVTTVPTVGSQPFVRPTSSEPWGVAKKVDDMTYTIRVGEDDTMATAQEIFEALNQYRNVNGKSSLTWSDSLAHYAQSRAQHFNSISGTDKHAGFDNFLNNENGFQALGFRRIGENSYFGGKLNGVHMIEWVFAKSPGHNANQLDEGWSYVGIGVTDTSANLNFGGERM